ncbi:ADP-ribosylation factor GTPase-activating protein 1 [Nowakowskiella sp. JEL0407]|nr:ADP-ribosylation factor GTPase-activating protein 1 [Nowakowskiella sp. JEL0407]
MDSWKEDQVKRMRLGGNRKCLEFFKKHPDWRDGMSITEKYNSEFARLYKDKLDAICEGREWSMASAKKTTAIKSSPTTNNNSTNFSMPTKSQKEDYFKSKGMENESRSDALPPSQGGKYVGFGSSYTPPPQPQSSIVPDAILNDAIGTLSKGWSLMSSTAQTAVGVAGQVAGSIATEGAKAAVVVSGTISNKLNENLNPEVTTNVSSFVSGLGAKVADTGSKGIQYFSSLVGTNGMGFVERSYYSFVSGDSNFEGNYKDNSVRKSEDLNNWDVWNDMPTQNEQKKEYPIPQSTADNSKKDSWNNDGNWESWDGKEKKGKEENGWDEATEAKEERNTAKGWDDWGDSSIKSSNATSSANAKTTAAVITTKADPAHSGWQDEWEDF